MNEVIHGRVCLLQRVLPSYRVPFFKALGANCEKGLYLAAGKPRTSENIMTIDSIEKVNISSIKNIHLFQNSTYLCWQTGLVRWLKKSKPDYLIVEANPRYLSIPFLIKKAHKLNIPVIGWGLGANPRKPIISILRKFRLKKYDAMIAYSKKGAQEYIEEGMDRDSVFVAINAVTSKPQTEMPVREQSFKNKPVIVFTGRLQARKRVDNLINACADLPEHIRPDLWIIGDGPEKENLNHLAQTRYPKTMFYGALFGNDLDELLSKADIFVLPGTGGLAIQQAMSFGLPVITAEADGTQNDLVSKGNGWIVPPNNIKVLTKTIEIALSDVRKLREMGRAGFNLANKEINIENMVQVFASACKFALQKVKNNNKIVP